MVFTSKRTTLNHKLFLFVLGLLLNVLAASFVVASDHHTPRDLRTRYYDTSMACATDPKAPAVFCTGILLRGTRHSAQYKAWEPSPISDKTGGISFSYLRKDAKFSKLAGNMYNGLIMYPTLASPAGKQSVWPWCAFPFDAATNTRSGELGCGAQNAYGGFRPSSDLCTKSMPGGMTMPGSTWAAKYVRGEFASHPGRPDAYDGCGYQMFNNTNRVGEFQEFINAIHVLGQVAFNEQNEIRVQTWNHNIPEKLPIEAFFYLYNHPNTNDGRIAAKQDQLDLWNATNRRVWVPVISLRLPRNINEDATFEYFASDQAIQPPN